MVGTKKWIYVIGIVAIVIISIFVGMQISHSSNFSVLVDSSDFSISIYPIQGSVEQDGALQAVGYFSNEPGDDLRVAEKLAAEYVNAVNDKDVEKLVEISDTPFYVNYDVMAMTSEDLRNMYQNLIEEEENSYSKVTGMQSMKVYELEENEYDVSEFKKHLDENDVVVVITFWVEELDGANSGYESYSGFMFKKNGQYMKLIGGFT